MIYQALGIIMKQCFVTIYLGGYSFFEYNTRSIVVSTKKENNKVTCAWKLSCILCTIAWYRNKQSKPLNTILFIRYMSKISRTLFAVYTKCGSTVNCFLSLAFPFKLI